MGKSRITFSKKSLETIRVELLWREVVRSLFSSVMGNMKILLTMAIVLGALIIVQASSSKEFTLDDTVKNCNCMDYLKWKIWFYSWLSHLSYWPGAPLVEKKRVHHWKDTVRLILITIEYWNPNKFFWIPSSLSSQRVKHRFQIFCFELHGFGNFDYRKSFSLSKTSTFNAP